jgi:hypothetical protein
MFADQTAEDGSTENDQENDATGGNQYFDERSEIHEVYWIACDANRRNGPQILQNDDLSVKGTDAGVSGAVDDYRFFNDQKTELIEEITGEKDMYGLRKYREDFPTPDEEMWKEAGSEHFGITIVGVHEIPADEAAEKFNVDYSKNEVDPIFVPILETEDGEEVIYSPVDFYDSDETQGSEPEETEADADTGEGEESEAEPDLPMEPKAAQEYLEEQPAVEHTMQMQSALLKLRDPSRTNTDIAEEVDCSKNTVRNGIQKFVGEDGYEDLKERGRQLRSGDYEEQMTATTDGGEVTEEAESTRIEELEARVERLESAFNMDALQKL